MIDHDIYAILSLKKAFEIYQQNKRIELLGWSKKGLR